MRYLFDTNPEFFLFFFLFFFLMMLLACALSMLLNRSQHPIVRNLFGDSKAEAEITALKNSQYRQLLTRISLLEKAVCDMQGSAPERQEQSVTHQA